MGAKLSFLIMAAFILAAAAPARAAWVLQPVDGYGCPPGFELEVISSDEGAIDVCVSEEGPSAPAANEETPDHTAIGPQGEDVEETIRM